MAEFPDSSFFNLDTAGPDVNAAMMRWFETTKQLPGAMPAQRLTIENNAIAPQYADIVLDTEGQAAADDLEIIDPSNIHDGAIIYLRSTDNERKITVKHNPAQEYGIQLMNQQDRNLSSLIYMQLVRNGNKWLEMGNDIGRPYQQIYDVAGTPYTWTAPRDGWYRVWVIGGGGGSGSVYKISTASYTATGGGAGGSGAMKLIYLTAGTEISITVGTGGAGGTVSSSSATNAGKTGGASSFGEILSAPGGGGSQGLYDTATTGQNNVGTGSTSGAPGAGGDINVIGMAGMGAYFTHQGVQFGAAGNGGMAGFGFAGSSVGRVAYCGAGAAGVGLTGPGQVNGNKGGDGLILIMSA